MEQKSGGRAQFLLLLVHVENATSHSPGRLPWTPGIECGSPGRGAAPLPRWAKARREGSPEGNRATEPASLATEEPDNQGPQQDEKLLACCLTVLCEKKKKNEKKEGGKRRVG